jgi:hypothetical protein
MQWVYVVSSNRRYEGSNMLRICSNYDKAFAYLEELVKGKNNEWAHRWKDENFHVMPDLGRSRFKHEGLEGGSDVRWYYVDCEDDEHTYDIETEPLY